MSFIFPVPFMSARHWNIDVVADKRRKRLMEVSKRVRKESMKVNAEFSRKVDHRPFASS